MSIVARTLPRPPAAPAVSTTVTYYLSFIGLGLVSASLGRTLPDLALQTGVGLDQVSSVIVARSLGFLIGSFFVGRAYDRMPAHPIMATMLVGMACLMALVPFVPWLWVMVGLMLLIGITMGSVDVGGNTLLVWLHRERVGPYMNGLHFVWGIGAFLAPLLITMTLLVSNGLSWGYGLLALLLLPLPPLLLRLPSPRAQPIDDNAALPTARPIVIALITLIFFLYISGEVSMVDWVFTYTVRLGLTDEISASYLNSALFGALTLARLIAIPLATRFRPVQILFADLGICMASAALILLVPHSLLALWVGTIGLGAGMASIFPTLLDLAQRYVPLKGSTNGWFFMGGSLGGMTLPWLVGQWFEPIGPAVVFVVILSSFALAAVMLGVLVTALPPQQPRA